MQVKDPHSLPPCRPLVTSLVSFPQRLAYESNISFTHINDNKNNKFYIEIQLISSYIKHPQRGYKLI